PFEGGEGAGKTIQARAAAEYLRSRGRRVAETREPGATAVGRRIRAILLDPEVSDLDFRAELLLYMADRAQHVHAVIRPALDAGRIVLCDRYLDATLAYQGYARGLDVDLIHDLHRRVLEDLQPDATLLLDLPPEIGLERAWSAVSDGGRDRSETRFEAETLAFHRRVRDGYLDLARRFSDRFRVIDAQPDEARVREAVQWALNEMLDL
ncbi:MAG: dTMP kinase, partial [Desulfococcaceae bacterium]